MEDVDNGEFPPVLVPNPRLCAQVEVCLATAPVTVDREPLFVFDNYSSFYRLAKVAYFVHKFISMLKHRRQVRLGLVGQENVSYAELLHRGIRSILLQEQRLCFQDLTQYFDNPV